MNAWLEHNTHEFNEENLDNFANNLKEMLKSRFRDYNWRPKITMSNLGTKCEKKLWHTVNDDPSEDTEKLKGADVLKFLYGDVIEELILLFAAEAGHKVEGVQDWTSIEGVRGRRDAVIDGTLVDVKSTNDRGMYKFKKGLTHAEDPFGYLVQLDTYLHSAVDDPIVTDKEHAAFLVVDKTLGHIIVDKHRKSRKDYKKVVEQKQAMVAKDTPPARMYMDKPDGKSGNRKLDTECKYCNHKKKCWPGLRTFIYSNGPTYLTKVVKTPKVPEVT